MLRPAARSLHATSADASPDWHLRGLLAREYEMLRRYLGEIRFNKIANAYMADRPSRSADALRYGARLPVFLAEEHGFKLTPEIIELAWFEKALSDAFDAADAQTLAMDDLSRIAPEEYNATCFKFHPSVHRLAQKHNATSLWSALKCAETPPRPHALENPQQLLMWRQGAAPRFRILGDEEAAMFDAAIGGGSFDVLCKMLALSEGGEAAPVRAAAYLRGWAEAGILCADAAK